MSNADEKDLPAPLLPQQLAQTFLPEAQASPARVMTPKKRFDAVESLENVPQEQKEQLSKLLDLDNLGDQEATIATVSNFKVEKLAAPSPKFVATPIVFDLPGSPKKQTPLKTEAASTPISTVKSIVIKTTPKKVVSLSASNSPKFVVGSIDSLGQTNESTAKRRLFEGPSSAPQSPKKVLFGPPLSPEIFDKNLPPASPIKRGSSPMKVSESPKKSAKAFSVSLSKLRNVFSVQEDDSFISNGDNENAENVFVNQVTEESVEKEVLTADAKEVPEENEILTVDAKENIIQEKAEIVQDEIVVAKDEIASEVMAIEKLIDSAVEPIVETVKVATPNRKQAVHNFKTPEKIIGRSTTNNTPVRTRDVIVAPLTEKPSRRRKSMYVAPLEKGIEVESETTAEESETAAEDVPMEEDSYTENVIITETVEEIAHQDQVAIEANHETPTNEEPNEKAVELTTETFEAESVEIEEKITSDIPVVEAPVSETVVSREPVVECAQDSHSAEEEKVDDTIAVEEPVKVSTPRRSVRKSMYVAKAEAVVTRKKTRKSMYELKIQNASVENSSSIIESQNLVTEVQIAEEPVGVEATDEIKHADHIQTTEDVPVAGRVEVEPNEEQTGKLETVAVVIETKNENEGLLDETIEEVVEEVIEKAVESAKEEPIVEALVEKANDNELPKTPRRGRPARTVSTPKTEKKATAKTVGRRGRKSMYDPTTVDIEGLKNSQFEIPKEEIHNEKEEIDEKVALVETVEASVEENVAQEEVKEHVIQQEVSIEEPKDELIVQEEFKVEKVGEEVIEESKETEAEVKDNEVLNAIETEHSATEMESAKPKRGRPAKITRNSRKRAPVESAPESSDMEVVTSRRNARTKKAKVEENQQVEEVKVEETAPQLEPDVKQEEKLNPTGVTLELAPKRSTRGRKTEVETPKTAIRRSARKHLDVETDKEEVENESKHESEVKAKRTRKRGRGAESSTETEAVTTDAEGPKRGRRKIAEAKIEKHEKKEETAELPVVRSLRNRKEKVDSDCPASSDAETKVRTRRKATDPVVESLPDTPRRSLRSRK
jgi:hypothetical protein